MKITVVKKGTVNAKPLASCPFMVDDNGIQGQKK